MNLHEYQAKILFDKYGLPVPKGQVIASIDEVDGAIANLGTSEVVVKAQVHAGGRGKAGGVKLVSSKEELKEAVKNMLGQRLVTYQTDADGQPINQVLIEEKTQIKKELYLGAVLDRTVSRVVLMVSTEGGVEIEKVAEETPEKIIKIMVDPLLGVMPYQCREAAFKLGLAKEQMKSFANIASTIAKLFVECDLSLIEINPLIINGEGELICLDGKINVDDNAIYRQPEIAAMRDKTQENERENHAKDWDLSYVALDGNIGCMVNGAGLAMATMDLIKLKGGEPANFLDVGGTATEERVKEAFKIILADGSVKAILVNIFGGIVRCDLIADGIIKAVNEVGVTIPVVVRLEGNKADAAADILAKSGLNIISATSLNEAAEKAVSSVK